MNGRPANSASKEREASVLNGWVMLIVNLALLIGAVACAILIIVHTVRTDNPLNLWWLVAG